MKVLYKLPWTPACTGEYGSESPSESGTSSTPPHMGRSRGKPCMSPACIQNSGTEEAEGMGLFWQEELGIWGWEEAIHSANCIFMFVLCTGISCF